MSVKRFCLEINNIYFSTKDDCAYHALKYLANYHNIELINVISDRCSFEKCIKLCTKDEDKGRFIKLDSDKAEITLNRIKYSLLSNRVVVGGFQVPISVKSKSNVISGIIDYAWLTKYGHGVAFIGFDDDFMHQGYKGCFIFVNNWGTGWGNNGIGYLPYRFITNNKSRDFWCIGHQYDLTKIDSMCQH